MMFFYVLMSFPVFLLVNISWTLMNMNSRLPVYTDFFLKLFIFEKFLILLSFLAELDKNPLIIYRWIMHIHLDISKNIEDIIFQCFMDFFIWPVEFFYSRGVRWSNSNFKLECFTFINCISTRVLDRLVL